MFCSASSGFIDCGTYNKYISDYNFNSEQTLTFVPKIIAVFLTLMLLAGWIGNNLTDFMNDLWGSFNTLCGF